MPSAERAIRMSARSALNFVPMFHVAIRLPFSLSEIPAAPRTRRIDERQITFFFLIAYASIAIHGVQIEAPARGLNLSGRFSALGARPRGGFVPCKQRDSRLLDPAFPEFYDTELQFRGRAVVVFMLELRSRSQNVVRLLTHGFLARAEERILSGEHGVSLAVDSEVSRLSSQILLLFVLNRE